MEKKVLFAISAFLAVPFSAAADEAANDNAARAKLGKLPTKATVGIAGTWSAGWSETGIAPHRGSLRLRSKGGWVLEPQLSLSEYRTEFDGVEGDWESESASASLIVRAPLAQKRNLALQFLFGISGAYSKFANSSEELGWDQTSYGLSADWGLGIEWFSSRHLSLGADLMSGLRTESWSELEGVDQRSGSWGPLFSPQLSVNAALYY